MTETTPASIDALAATIRDFARDGRRFAVRGGGTKAALGNAGAPLDAVVRTASLARTIDYVPSDQVIAVEAGMTLAALDAILAERDQMLPLDGGDRTRATVGGVVATGSYGARRLRYGTPKDVIVGVELVRPDGTRARGGGKVVKNVAGFDLPKLAVGSLGTLGAIASATFRVYPRPAASAALVVGGRTPAPGALDPLVAALLAAQAEPTSIARYAKRDGGTWHDLGTVVRFDGSPAGVRAQRDRLAAIAREHGWSCDEPDAAALAPVEDGERRVRSAYGWCARLSAPPSSAEQPGALWRVAKEAVFYPALGVALLGGDDGGAADVAAQRALAGTQTVFEAMPDAWRAARVDAWGQPPPSFALMRALKSAFDPRGICNPGRFVGGL